MKKKELYHILHCLACVSGLWVELTGTEEHLYTGILYLLVAWQACIMHCSVCLPLLYVADNY